MGMAQKNIDLDLLAIMLNKGVSKGKAAEFWGVNNQTLTDQMMAYWGNPDTGEINIPDKIITSPNEDSNEPLQGDLLLNWSTIEDYLATGMTLEETSIACGVSKDYLKEEYLKRPDHDFESLELLAAVLRSRRTYELLKSVESRALNGDIRAFFTILKARYSRHSKDCPKPPSLERSGQI